MPSNQLTAFLFVILLPLLTAGLWLAISKKNTGDKILGAVVIFGTLVSVLLAVFFWYWQLFIAT